MAHEDTVMNLMIQLIYATKHDIGCLLAHKGFYRQEGASKVNNAYKDLITLTNRGLLEKGNNYFKLKGAKGEHQEHSRLITAELVKILKLNYQTRIYRECFIQDKGLIPDAMILLVNGNKAAVYILEVRHHETQTYFDQKVRVWESWAEAQDYLSKLFNIKVKSFQIINNVEEIEKCIE